MCVRRSRAGTQSRCVAARLRRGRDQTRRTARDDAGRSGWTWKTHQPEAFSWLSGPIESDWWGAGGAPATYADSCCRASVTNSATAAASWQPAVDAKCGPLGKAWDPSWHPAARWWLSAAGLAHHSSQASEPLGPPARTITIRHVAVRSIALDAKGASAVPFGNAWNGLKNAR